MQILTCTSFTLSHRQYITERYLSNDALGLAMISLASPERMSPLQQSDGVKKQSSSFKEVFSNLMLQHVIELLQTLKIGIWSCATNSAQLTSQYVKLTDDPFSKHLRSISLIRKILKKFRSFIQHLFWLLFGEFELG